MTSTFVHSTSQPSLGHADAHPTTNTPVHNQPSIGSGPIKSPLSPIQKRSILKKRSTSVSKTNSTEAHLPADISPSTDEESPGTTNIGSFHSMEEKTSSLASPNSGSIMSPDLSKIQRRRVSFSYEVPTRTTAEILNDQKKIGIIPDDLIAETWAAKQDVTRQKRQEVKKSMKPLGLGKKLRREKEMNGSSSGSSSNNGSREPEEEEEVEEESEWFQKRKIIVTGLLKSKMRFQLDAKDIQDPDKQGFLLIKPQSVMNETWKLRYCIIKKQWMFIMRDPEHLIASNIINLGHCVLDQFEGKRDGFQLHRLGRYKNFAFEAEDGSDKLLWMEVILKNIHLAWKEDVQLRDRVKKDLNDSCLDLKKLMPEYKAVLENPVAPFLTLHQPQQQNAVMSSPATYRDRRRHSISIISPSTLLKEKNMTDDPKFEEYIKQAFGSKEAATTVVEHLQPTQQLKQKKNNRRNSFSAYPIREHEPTTINLESDTCADQPDHTTTSLCTTIMSPGGEIEVCRPLVPFQKPAKVSSNDSEMAGQTKYDLICDNLRQNTDMDNTQIVTQMINMALKDKHDLQISNHKTMEQRRRSISMTEELGTEIAKLF